LSQREHRIIDVNAGTAGGRNAEALLKTLHELLD